LLLVLLHNLTEDGSVCDELSFLVCDELLGEKAAWSAASLLLAVGERLSYYRPFSLIELEWHSCLVQRFYELILLEEWLINEGVKVLAFEPSVRIRRYQTVYQ